jgi:preprotein translocase subunit YajC
MEGISPLLIFGAAIIAMVYFFMIRPLRNREKQHDQLVLELEKGDRVITAGGMYGVVETIEDDGIILRVESGAMIRVTKGGVVAKPEDRLGR